MEKTLVLIRHAKAEAGDILHSDFDRSLDKRGLGDAAFMGNRLKESGIIPDKIISSPARRTRETTQLISGALGYDTDSVIWPEALYNCPAYSFDDVIASCNIADNVQTLFVVAHNPGISYYAFGLCAGRLPLESLPTCGIVGVRLQVPSWHDMAMARSSMLFFDYPGNLG